MKYIKTLISTAVCGIVMALAISASAQTQGSATIVRMQGEARYSTGDNIWHPLEVGAVLRAGAIIQTAAGATVDIVLSEKKSKTDSLGSGKGGSGSGSSASPTVKQNIVRMWGDTVLAIDKLLYSQAGADAVSETQLDLRAGKIFGTVKKLSAASKYEIKTPTGIAGIRGTSYTMGSDNVCVVYDGSVTVSITVGGVTHTETVAAGQSAAVDPVTGAITVITIAAPGTKEFDDFKAAGLAAAEANGTLKTDDTVAPCGTETDTGTSVHVSSVQGSDTEQQAPPPQN